MNYIQKPNFWLKYFRRKMSPVGFLNLNKNITACFYRKNERYALGGLAAATKIPGHRFAQIITDFDAGGMVMEMMS